MGSYSLTTDTVTPLSSSKQQIRMFRKHHNRNGITSTSSEDEDFELTGQDRDPIADPAPQNHIVKCRITRNRKGIRGLFPTFFLHMERGDGRKVFLLASRRRIKSSTTSYLISADPAHWSSSGAAFRAILNSNILGTQFRLLGRVKKVVRRPGLRGKQ